MRPAIGKRAIKSTLLWIAIGAVAAALGCASSSEYADEEGDAASGGRSSLSGEEVGGSDFERYGGTMGSELSSRERDALGLQTVYFDFDQFSLNSTARETLRRNAEILRSHSDILVEIRGNCDERGSEEYNLALGERRARSAKDYLVNSGISRQRISTVSFGESNPAATGRSERAWQLNRRDDFVPNR
jgi:peptidoglycan-associated lipoprotein